MPKTNGNGWLTKWILGALLTGCSTLLVLGYQNLRGEIITLQETGPAIMQIQLDLVDIRADIKERKYIDSLVLSTLEKIDNRLERMR